MSKDIIQYVNIVKNQQNIKIDYRILEKNNIIKTEQSIFLLDNNNISSDTLFKLSSLEANVKQTYITAICEDKGQKIIPKIEKIDTSELSATYNRYYNIISNRSTIENTKLFYNKGDIDYLISPFSILDDIIANSKDSNSLNILILNDTLYAVILDEEKQFISSAIKSLTPYDEIKNSKFYNDEIVEQKLFDEIYLLELTDNISNITKDFYENEKNSSFIETVNIFYIVSQLNDEQIKSLEESLMMNINYKQISIDEHMYNIVQKQNAKQYSFIEPRKKKTGFSLFFWIIIAVLSTLITAGVLYFLTQKEPKEEKKIVKKVTKVKEPIKDKVVKIEPIKLTDHNRTNTQIITLIKNLFDLIDDNSTLKEVQLQKRESTIIYDFKDEFSFEKNLQPKLLKYYKYSEIILKTKNKNLYTAIISNTALIEKISYKTKKYIQNKQIKALTEQSSKELLKSIFNKTTTIKQISKVTNKYTKYTYKIKTIIQEPTEFFEAIKTINKQPYSYVLKFPIEFAKINEGIEVNFQLTLNQNLDK